MKPTLVLAVLTFVVPRPGAAAETKLREISWTALRDQGALAAGLRVDSDGSLSITSRPGEALRVTLAEIAAPGITKDRYVVRGRIRYRAVAGDGFLEMWSLFGDGGRYFTRTLGDSGPLQKITGSSEWRDFGLYFDATGAKAPPEKLILGLVLPQGGEVSISNATLSELDGGAPRENAGRVGAVAGATLGLLGAILGTLAGAGRARTLVLAALKTLAAAGTVGLASGLIAVARGASYETWFPWVLVSAIALAVSVLSLPGVSKRYQELELRRMRAMDA